MNTSSFARTMSRLLTVGCLTLVCSTTFAGTPEEDRNKQTAIEFYAAALNEKDWDKAKQYIGPRYVQHSIYMEDGAAGFEALVNRISTEFPQNHGEIKQAFADGDMVILHLHVTRYPGHAGWSVIELMRLENDKVVEHWDVFQPVPGETANSHGMF
jgi:predicted SnoaL-like aldol condensation-catalyzing enzyme